MATTAPTRPTFRGKEKDIKGALGFVDFDGTTGTNVGISMVVPREEMDKIYRGRYVTLNGGRAAGGEMVYLGRIVEGPYYAPDAVGKDSPYARTSILDAKEFPGLPEFHAICQVELLGMIGEDNLLRGVTSRPYPKTPIFQLDPVELESLLGLGGDVFLGGLDGYESVRVNFDSNAKKVLPRNLGIFGTVGSGKTNTAQVLIEEASVAKWAVIVLDVEGEYISLDKPTGEKSMREALKDVGLQPKGIQDLEVIRSSAAESRRKGARAFSISFGQINQYVLAELMDMNDAQEERFFQAYEACFAQRGSPKGGRKKSTLDRVLSGDEDEEESFGLTLQSVMNKIDQWLHAGVDDRGNPMSSRASWGKVKSQLRSLQRLRVFDTKDDPLDVQKMLKPGKVTVIDVSEAGSDRVNNVVIAELLRQLFRAKLRDESTPKTLVLIEEAHTFVSREKAGRMQATLDMLREISRRGRKRWLSLCFISQQPSHLPNELYELTNTKIIHETTGSSNLSTLKVSAGSVNEALWTDVPVLGQGRAVVISPQFRHPILVRVRPSMSHREFTE